MKTNIWLIFLCTLAWSNIQAQVGKSVVSGYLGKRQVLEVGGYVVPAVKISEDGSLTDRLGLQVQVGRAVARHATLRLGFFAGGSSKDVLLAPGDSYPEWAKSDFSLKGLGLGLELHGDQLAPIGKYLSAELSWMSPSVQFSHFLTELEDGDPAPYMQEYDQVYAEMPSAHYAFRLRLGQRTIIRDALCWNFGLSAGYVLNQPKVERAHPRLANFNTAMYDFNSWQRQYFALQVYVLVGMVW